MINYIYKYIQQLFNLISQFMHDDLIKSPLLIEARGYHKNREKLNNRYPYDNALKMMKTIQQLGKVDNMSYLDKFRKIITKLGNTLGFVRMVRTASIKDSSSMIKFIPFFAKDADFKADLEGLGIDG